MLKSVYPRAFMLKEYVFIVVVAIFTIRSRNFFVEGFIWSELASESLSSALSVVSSFDVSSKDERLFSSSYAPDKSKSLKKSFRAVSIPSVAKTSSLFNLFSVSFNSLNGS